MSKTIGMAYWYVRWIPSNVRVHNTSQDVWGARNKFCVKTTV